MAFVDENELIKLRQRVERLENMKAGQGVTISRAPGGVVISAGSNKPTGTSGGGDPRIEYHTSTRELGYYRGGVWTVITTAIPHS